MASSDARGNSVSGVKNYEAGRGNAASFMVSGFPFVKTTTTDASGPGELVDFGGITKSVTFYGTSPVTISFRGELDADGAALKAVLPANVALTFDVACAKVWVGSPADVSVIASVTAIAP